MGRRTLFAGAVGACVCSFLVLSAPPALEGGSPPPAYSANALGIGGGSPESFVGKFAGDDMLPYTEDDIELAEEGNQGGTWGFAHMDLNSDNVIDPDDPIFVSVRNNDDDSVLYSTLSRPEYGVIYESEDWVEYWEANQVGPTGPIVDTNQTDFEINDWNGWTDESNAYVYNNIGRNQRGLGLPKYRVDYRTAPAEGQEFVFDEIEGWQKSFGFRNTADDVDTPFNERGGCRRWFRAREEIDMRGYLIPVDDLEELEDGSLPTLYGWEEVDMAAYFRDTVAPLLDHPDLFVFTETGLPLEQLLPLTHVYLLQMSVPFQVDNGEGECGGSNDPVCQGDPDPALCQVRNHAAYWGITEESTFRYSHLMGLNADLPDLVFGAGAIHPWVDEPDDGAELNLWIQDHFWRAEADHIGKYELVSSPSAATFAATLDAAQEVPPPVKAQEGPIGSGTFSYDFGTRELTWNIEYIEALLSSLATAAHIHSGEPGVAGPVEIPLSNQPTSPLQGSATLTPAQEALLLAGNLYVNIHTEVNQPGEIRGQILRDPSWTIVDEPGLAFYDNTNDQVIVAGGPGAAISAPLPRPLSIAETPLIVVADLASNVSPFGGAEPGSYQIIVRSGDTVIAYADISGAGTQVHLGGSYDASTGVASGPDTSGDVGGPAEMGEFDTSVLLGEYERFVLRITGTGASLRRALPGFEIRSFSGLDALGDELASVTQVDGEGNPIPIAYGEGATHVTIGGTGVTALSTLLVFASPGVGPFVRGDCQQNGATDLSDAVNLLGWLFLGAEDPPCLASCAFDGRADLDITTAVHLFSFLFLGTVDELLPPRVSPAFSQRANDFVVGGCGDYSP